MNLSEILAQVLDHVRGMWRYRWHMIVLAWLVALPGWGYVYSMPDIYQASAKVSVDSNSMLPQLTAGLTATENLASEVALVSKALLSRPNLESVARQTDLDLRAQTPGEMEGLITGLQSRLRVQAGRDRVFTISFTDQNRSKAAEVVSALLNTFMEESLGGQGEDTDMTSRALQMEIDDHEDRLVKAEAALADFKKRNLGYMPEDGQDYYGRLQGVLANVASTEQQIRQQRQRRDEIARQLAGEEPLFATPGQVAASCSRAANITQLQGQLSALQVEFTDVHPRIIILKETIAAQHAECEKELAAMAGTNWSASPGTQDPNANPMYQNLRLLLSNANVELAALQEAYNSYKREEAQLRADVDKIGVVETDLKKLNRDYDVITSRHQTLLGRWESLQSKKRLDPVTDLVQFRILEPPFAAATPVAPNRPLFSIAVVILALGAGGALAFALNQLNPVFYTRKAITSIVGLPVLGSVTMILSPTEISARRRSTVAWAGANLILVLAAAAVIVLDTRISNIVVRLFEGSIL